MGIYVYVKLVNEQDDVLAEFAGDWLGESLSDEDVAVNKIVRKHYIDTPHIEQALGYAWWKVWSELPLYRLDPFSHGLCEVGKVTGAMRHAFPGLFDDTCGDIPRNRVPDLLRFIGCKKIRMDLIDEVYYG